MSKLRRVVIHLSALVLVACGQSGGGGGDDELEADMLRGLDEPAVITEAELDEAFPLVAPVEPVEDDAPSDPTAGGDLEARFAAYTPSRAADGLFTIPAVEGVPADFMATVSRGLLFGLDNFAARLPAFDVYAAVAARPFTVNVFTAPRGATGFRASVQACPNAPATWEECRPLVNIPYEVAGGALKPVRAATFVHEMGHLGHVLYSLSSEYKTAGGLALGPFRHDEFRWQREGSAQFLTARAPDWAAYDRLGSTSCAFTALQQGAFAWRDFSPTGDGARLPYQMALLIDQVSWFQFGGGTDWLLDWWVARPDGRSAAVPESPARALMRMVSPSKSSVDLAALNQVVARASVDLFVRGRDPWTTRALSAECYDPALLGVGVDTPGAATVSVPAIGFRAVSMPIDDDAIDSLSSLQLALSSDRPAVRAAVYAISVADYVSCVAALPGSALGEESPRKACNATYAMVVGPLHAQNGYRHTLKLTAALRTKLKGKSLVAVIFHPWTTGAPRTPATVTFTAGPPQASALNVTLRNNSSEDHVHFSMGTTGSSITVNRGASANLVVPSAAPGDELTFTVRKPSDFGPVFAASGTCRVSETPNNPTVTYTGSVSCTGF